VIPVNHLRWSPRSWEAGKFQLPRCDQYSAGADTGIWIVQSDAHLLLCRAYQHAMKAVSWLRSSPVYESPRISRTTLMTVPIWWRPEGQLAGQRGMRDGVGRGRLDRGDVFGFHRCADWNPGRVASTAGTGPPRTISPAWGRSWRHAAKSEFILPCSFSVNSRYRSSLSSSYSIKLRSMP
jgi:hypothetical protein